MQANELRALKDCHGSTENKLVLTFLEHKIAGHREQLETELDTKEIFRLQGRIEGLKGAMADMAPDEFQPQKTGGYTV